MTLENFNIPQDAKKLTPLEMNNIAVFKAHTVIVFPEKPKAE